jgi:hypothetical protein
MALLLIVGCSDRNSSSSEVRDRAKGRSLELVASNARLDRGEAIGFGFHPTVARASVSWAGSGRVMVCPPQAFPHARGSFAWGDWGRRWPHCGPASRSGSIRLPAGDGWTHYAVALVARESNVTLERATLRYTSVDEFGVFRVIAPPPGGRAARLSVRPPLGSSRRGGIETITTDSGGRVDVELRHKDVVVASGEARGSGGSPDLPAFDFGADALVLTSRTGRSEPVVVYVVLRFVSDARST